MYKGMATENKRQPSDETDEAATSLSGAQSFGAGAAEGQLVTGNASQGLNREVATAVSTGGLSLRAAIASESIAGRFTYTVSDGCEDSPSKNLFLFGNETSTDILHDFLPGGDKIDCQSHNIAGRQLQFEDLDLIRHGEGPLIQERAEYPAKKVSLEDVSASNFTLELIGTDRGEVLNGTIDDDIIQGKGGDDLLRGGLGDDSLDGGDGNDVLSGGSGDDILIGGDGNDVLQADAGDDLLVGGSGLDNIQGGDGIDVIRGGGDDDDIDAGQGDDSANGGAGDDIVHGGAGDDELRGNSGDDEVYGDDGADQIYGGGGADMLYGGEGDDLIIGVTGDDTIYGGEGNDKLFGRADNDMMFGEAGADRLTGAAADDTLDGGEGRDILAGGGGADNLTGGGGQDVFVFLNERGEDVITDFQAGLDRINLTKRTYGERELAFSDLELIASGTDTIVLDRGLSITLENVSVNQLIEDDFQF